MFRKSVLHLAPESVVYKLDDGYLRGGKAVIARRQQLLIDLNHGD